MDDLQNSTTTDCLYHVFALMQNVNEYSLAPGARAADDIRSQIQHIERVSSPASCSPARPADTPQTYGSVFQLSSRMSITRSPARMNMDLTVARFHATRIYFHRSSLPKNTPFVRDPTIPPLMQSSLSAILAIAQSVFSLSVSHPYERLQWPLFMVGIETEDFIHLDWVLSHMRKSALKTALKRVMKAQEATGLRLTMDAVRNVVGNVDAGMDDSMSVEQLLSVMETGAFNEEDGENEFCLW